MNVCCEFFALESPHRGDSNEYIQYTIFNIKKKITPNYPTFEAIGFCSKGLESEFETAVVIRATEVLLYIKRGDDVILRNVIDYLPNGGLFIEFLVDCGMCMVNSRVGQTDFTHVSYRGKSIIDYICIPMNKYCQCPTSMYIECPSW